MFLCAYLQNGSASIAALAGGEIWANRQVCPTIVGVCAEVRSCFNGAPRHRHHPSTSWERRRPAGPLRDDSPNCRRDVSSLRTCNPVQYENLADIPSSCKAPEDWRTPRRFAYFRNHLVARSVLDCGGS